MPRYLRTELQRRTAAYNWNLGRLTYGKNNLRQLIYAAFIPSEIKTQLLNEVNVLFSAITTELTSAHELFKLEEEKKKQNDA